MPSLKDLKNRIACVKNDSEDHQGHADGRGGQAPPCPGSGRGRAALCRADGSGGQRSRGVGRGVGQRAPPSGGHRQGPGASAGRHDTANAALPAASTRRSSNWRVRMPRKLLAAGKTVKILTVGKKGHEQLRRDMSEYMVDHVDLAEIKQIGFDTARDIAHLVMARFEAGEFDVATMFFDRFQSVISQIPTAQQIIPAPVESRDVAEVRAPAVYEYEPLGRGDPRRPAAALHRHADLQGAARKQRLVQRRADVRHGQRDAQRGRHDRQADHRATTAQRQAVRSPTNSSKSFRAPKRSKATARKTTMATEKKPPATVAFRRSSAPSSTCSSKDPCPPF